MIRPRGSMPRGRLSGMQAVRSHAHSTVAYTRVVAVAVVAVVAAAVMWYVPEAKIARREEEGVDGRVPGVADVTAADGGVLGPVQVDAGDFPVDDLPHRGRGSCPSEAWLLVGRGRERLALRSSRTMRDGAPFPAMQPGRGGR